MPQFDDLVDDSQQPQAQQKPIMFDDLKEDQPQQPQFDDLVDDSEKHQTPVEQAKTVAENIGQGISAPAATEFETSDVPTGIAEAAKYVPGGLKIPFAIAKAVMGKVNPENIKARQEQNPGEALAGQAIGNIGLGALSPVGELASFGARGLKGAIESGAITANDEIGKAMLGQGDPTDAVAAKLLGSAGVGFLAGGLLGQRAQTASKELKLIQDSKLGSHISDFLSGMGHNAKFLPEVEQNIIPEGIKNKKAFGWGQKVFDSLHGKALATAIGYLTGKTEGTVVAPVIHEALKQLIGPQLEGKSQTYIAPMLLKAASSGVVKNPSQILEHAAAITKGDTALSKGIEACFATGAAKAAEELGDDKDQKLKDHIENGGIDEQLNQSQQDQSTNPPLPYAKGGEVKPMPELKQQNNEIANHWPEQNVMLNAAKSRISNYLNSQRPSPIQSQLPFDSKIKNPQHEREYGKVIHLANNPLSILNHVKDGTLTPDQMKHFTSMYPEVYNTMAKRMTKRLTESQLGEEQKPPYKIRQAMSLFLGSHLDSSVLPQNIIAAQQVFAQQKAQKQAVAKASALAKSSKLNQTPEQSREQRLTKT